MEYYLDKLDAFLLKVLLATFPGYKGRKFKLSTRIPSRLDSYWDGGSRDYYAFYCVPTNKTHSVHSNHPFFEQGQPRDLPGGLPQGMILVRHSIFCGKDMGITFHANEQDLAPLIPEQTDLTPDEKTVLHFTSGLKPSYNGIKNYRFHRAKEKTGITLEQWNAAKQALINTKHLNKAGAITPKGRNAIQGERVSMY